MVKEIKVQEVSTPNIDIESTAADEKVAEWLAKNLDMYCYNHSFEEYSKVCKEFFDVSVTEADFEKFKEQARQAYNLTKDNLV